MTTMNFSAYEITIEEFIRSCEVLAAILDKGEAHAKETGADPESYLDLRLAPDMFTLKMQVAAVCFGAKKTAIRMVDLEDQPMDKINSYAEMKDVVANTIKYLKNVDKTSLDSQDNKIIEFPDGIGRPWRFTGREYILRWALPNFNFHMTTAYAILRHQGVQLGKLDFLYPPSESKHMVQ